MTPALASPRLTFLARHFNDLQTIRFAPVPALMILAPLVERLPPVGRAGAWSLLLSFLSSVVGFFWWSTAAIRRRYGSVKNARDQSQKVRLHPITAALYAILALAMLVAPAYRRSYFDVYLALTIAVYMLERIVDSTNPGSRRIVWAMAMSLLFAAGPFLIGVDGDAAVCVFGGCIWLSLSVFDFLLLRRTFEELVA